MHMSISYIKYLKPIKLCWQNQGPVGVSEYLRSFSVASAFSDFVLFHSATSVCLTCVHVSDIWWLLWRILWVTRRCRVASLWTTWWVVRRRRCRFSATWILPSFCSFALTWEKQFLEEREYIWVVFYQLICGAWYKLFKWFIPHMKMKFRIFWHAEFISWPYFGGDSTSPAVYTSYDLASFP